MADASDGTVSILVGDSQSGITVLPTKLPHQKISTVEYVSHSYFHLHVVDI